MDKEEKERERELEKAAEREREKAEKSKDDPAGRAAAKAGNFLRKTRQWSSLCMDEVSMHNLKNSEYFIRTIHSESLTL